MFFKVRAKRISLPKKAGPSQNQYKATVQGSGSNENTNRNKIIQRWKVSKKPLRF